MTRDEQLQKEEIEIEFDESLTEEQKRLLMIDAKRRAIQRKKRFSEAACKP